MDVFALCRRSCDRFAWFLLGSLLWPVLSSADRRADGCVFIWAHFSGTGTLSGCFLTTLRAPPQAHGMLSRFPFRARCAPGPCLPSALCFALFMFCVFVLFADCLLCRHPRFPACCCPLTHPPIPPFTLLLPRPNSVIVASQPHSRALTTTCLVNAHPVIVILIFRKHPSR